jgi:hypothetical protein
MFILLTGLFTVSTSVGLKSNCIILCIVLNFQYTRVTISIKNNIFANVICNIYKKGVKGMTYIFSVVHNFIIVY